MLSFMLNKKLIKVQVLLFTLMVGSSSTFLSQQDIENKSDQLKVKSIQLDIVSSLAWGEVLFYYFSGDKMEALIRLYARESRNKLRPHQPQADLLAAGLLLDFGLAAEAQNRLEQIGHQNLNQKLNSRLALIMARVYFQSQDLSSSRFWLEKVDEQHLTGNELVRKKMMNAQLLFIEGRFIEAARQLENIDNKSNLQLYANYNQGLSLLKLADQAAQNNGRLLLTKISNIEPVDQEQYALVDQAKLALGLDAINLNLSLKAREFFINIRLDGLVSNDALLLLGWTYGQTDEFDKALTYWNRLANKAALFDPTVQEAWLAVPYAHQKLGDLSLAVKGYEKAVISQATALKQLDTMLQEHSWRVLLSLSENFSSESQAFPEDFKRMLIANPRFYTFLQEWRELSLFEEKLKKSLSILPTISLVLKENDQRYVQKSTLVNQKLQDNPSQKLYQTHDKLKIEFEQQKIKPIAEKFLSQENFVHWLKLQNLRTISKNIPDEVSDEKIEKIRRLQGVAQWNFHRERDENTSAAKAGLGKLKQTLIELSERLKTLKVLANKPRKSSTSDLLRIDELLKRGDDLVAQVVILQQELEVAMSDEFLKFVGQRQIALNSLAEQANLALARLRFKAIQESLNDD